MFNDIEYATEEKQCQGASEGGWQEEQVSVPHILFLPKAVEPEKPSFSMNLKLDVYMELAPGVLAGGRRLSGGPVNGLAVT